MGKPSGIDVLRSAAPKITEAQFLEALDMQLEVVFAQMSKETFRSRMHLAVVLGSRMQPQLIVRALSKTMGVSDVSILSLFARNPDVRKRVGERVKQRATADSKRLNAVHDKLPVVVEEDCREAAARRLALKEVAEGKRKPGAGDRQAAPMVGVVLKECLEAEEQPSLQCYVKAKDEAELKACDGA